MQAATFAAGTEALQKAFYRRLSLTHWAWTSQERNLYNLKVKGSANCLAFGPGAGGNHRRMVLSELEQLSAMAAGCERRLQAGDDACEARCPFLLFPGHGDGTGTGLDGSCPDGAYVRGDASSDIVSSARAVVLCGAGIPLPMTILPLF